MARITVVVFHQQATLITFIFTGVAARIRLFVRVVNAFEHV